MSKHEDLLPVVKQAGYGSVKEFSEACQTSSRTLSNWKKNYPKRFNVVVLGATKDKE